MRRRILVLLVLSLLIQGIGYATSLTNNNITSSTNSTRTNGKSIKKVGSRQTLLALYRAGKYSAVAKLLATHKKKHGMYPDYFTPQMLLVTLYHSGNSSLLRVYLRDNKVRLSRSSPVPHYWLALCYLQIQNSELFFFHAMHYLNQKKDVGAQQRALSLFHNKEYKKAVTTIQKLEPHIRKTQFWLRVITFCHIKNKDFQAALDTAKAAYATDINIPIPMLQLLFQLSLKTKSATEAVYWSKKIIAAAPQLLKNYQFLNNISMAHVYAYHTSASKQAQKKAAQLALRYAKIALRLKPIAATLHTLSLSYEINKNYTKAIEAIQLARALAPKNKSFIKRLRALQKKQRKTK